jgi:hypothetical protein
VALAWTVADAASELIAEVHAAAAKDMDDGQMSRSSLARAAIERLEGRPAGDLDRARSIALEMPPGLRYRAHRSDARDDIARQLNRVRRSGGGFGWLVVDVVQQVPPAGLPLYVQFSSFPPPGVRAEAVGDTHLPPELRPHDEQRARLRELGWREGSMELSTGNWVRDIGIGSPEARLRGADLALNTLETFTRSSTNVRYRPTFDIWRPEGMPST